MNWQLLVGLVAFGAGLALGTSIIGWGALVVLSWRKK